MSAMASSSRMCPSEVFRDEFERVVGFLVAFGLLAFWQLHFLPRGLLARNSTEDVTNDVEASSLFVVGPNHEPRRPRGIGRFEHFVACPRVVVPAAVRLEIHGREFPGLASILDSTFQPA